MSIEALIQSHTEALLANTEAVKLLTLSLAGRTPTKSEVTPAVEKPKTPTAAEKKAKEDAELAAIKAKDEQDLADAAAEDTIVHGGEKPKPVPYDVVRALVLKLAGGGKREEIKALNTKHGIANLKVLLGKEDDFSTVNDQAKLEAVYADLQALEG